MKKFKIAIGLLSVALGAGIAFGCKDKGNKSYTLSYAYDGSSYTIEVADGGDYAMENIPTKDGYVFDGLYDAENGGTQYVGKDGKSLRPFYNGRDITLFVRFVPRTYTIEFVYDNGALSSSAKCTVDNGSAMPDLPILNGLSEHKVFKGWYTAEENGTVVTNASGEATEEFATFDYSQFEQGENYSVKLYAYYAMEQVTVKFYNADTLIEERSVDYGTDITEASLGVKVGNLDVVCWTQDGETVLCGQITDDSEMSVLYLGKAVNLETQSGTIIVSGGNANILLYGDKDKTYRNVNISINNDNLNGAHIVMYNANIVGNATDGTVSSTGERPISIFSLGTRNSISTSEVGAPAVSVSGSLGLICDADIIVRGGDGTDGEKKESYGGNGGAGICAANLAIKARTCSVAISGGNGGHAYNRHYGENDGEGSDGRNGFNGGNGGYGVMIDNKLSLVSGNIAINGGNGGNGGNGSECNRSEITGKGDKHVVGGNGGNGGNGGAAVKAKIVNLSGGKLTAVGGNGGNAGKAGGVHDGDTSGWVFGDGTTTAEDGNAGTAGVGGTAIVNGSTFEGDRSEIMETQGNKGADATGTNRN